MRQYQLIKKIDQLQGLPVLLKINSEIFGTLATLPVTHTPEVYVKNINYSLLKKKGMKGFVILLVLAIVFPKSCGIGKGNLRQYCTPLSTTLYLYRQNFYFKIF